MQPFFHFHVFGRNRAKCLDILVVKSNDIPSKDIPWGRKRTKASRNEPVISHCHGPSCMKNPKILPGAGLLRRFKARDVKKESKQTGLGRILGNLVVGCFGYHLMMPPISHIIRWVRKSRFESPNSWNSKPFLKNEISWISREINTLKARR